MEDTGISDSADSAAQKLWSNGEISVLVRILTFVGVNEVSTLSRICKNTDAACRVEQFWKDAWPAASGCALDLPPSPYSSWKAAHQAVARFKRGKISFVTAPELAADVTCMCLIDGAHIYGCSDGCVRSYKLVKNDTKGGILLVEESSVQLGSGSVRHMQLVPRRQPPQTAHDRSPPTDYRATMTIWCGTWNGAVIQLRYDIGRGLTYVAPVISSLGGPVYALRIGFGRLFIGCGDSQISVWRLEDSVCKHVGTLNGHTGAVTDIHLQGCNDTSPRDQRLISTSYDGTVRLWSVATLECLMVCAGHRGPVWTVASSTHFIYSGSADGTIKAWHLTSKVDADSMRGGDCDMVMCPWASAAHKQIFCLKVFGGICFAGTSDGFIHVWDVCSGSLLSATQVSPDKDGIRRIDVWGELVVCCTTRGFVRLLRLIDGPRAAAAVVLDAPAAAVVVDAAAGLDGDA